jgi:hypothetical protein
MEDTLLSLISWSGTGFKHFHTLPEDTELVLAALKVIVPCTSRKNIFLECGSWRVYHRTFLPGRDILSLCPIHKRFLYEHWNFK